MEFTRITPHPALAEFIECYWMMYSDNKLPLVEKIIPDGFTELIFNYRDVYQSQISGHWRLQTPNLLAGQLRSYFYLQNTGTTGSVAIKLKPASLTQLYGLSMDQYVDQIVDLDGLAHPAFKALSEQISTTVALKHTQNSELIKELLDNYFMNLVPGATANPLKQPLDLIFQSNGMLTVVEMAITAGISERQLERLFKKYIGLSPKYYARIIRFNYIFKVITSKKSSWAEVVYQSGYYDQSHFICNFKAFTGEDPSAYYFEEKNMANFFLNK